ncbi:MAG: transposon-encoded TnpW family protein [Oscillospiraceae bacterium]|nr:transposon-encoded TnpW family protein [Oscillospiraceae bacterium]
MEQKTNKTIKTVYFDTYNEQKIGDTTYIIESHFQENGETLVDKIKNLTKEELRCSNSSEINV